MKKLLPTILLLIFCASIIEAQSLVYSPDGRWLAAVWELDFRNRQEFSQIIVYDAQSGRRKTLFDASQAPSHAAFSPDGRRLIYANTVTLGTLGWAAGGDSLTSLPSPHHGENFAREMNEQQNNGREFFGVGFSADGKTIYKLNSHFLNAHSAADLKFLPARSREIKEAAEDAPAWGEFVGMSDTASHVVEFENKVPDISLIVKTPGGGGEGSRFKLPYQIEAGDLPRVRAKVSRNGETMAASYAPSGEVRAQITLWDLKTRKSLDVLAIPALDLGFEDNFYLGGDYALSPDGKKIAAVFLGAGEAADQTRVVVRDISSGKTATIEFANRDGSHFAESVVFSPDPKHVATFSAVLSPGPFAPKIQVWDAETGKLVRAFE